METIYYFSQKVKLGDTVKFNGMNVPVTEQLVRKNPSMFEVVGGEPRKHVPQPDIADNFTDYVFTDDGFSIKAGSDVWFVPTPHSTIHDSDEDRYPEKDVAIHIVDNTFWKAFAKKENAEAYIRENKKDPLFTTVDGVDIYNGDISYAIERESLKIIGPERFGGVFPENKLYFSTKEAARQYMIDKLFNDQ